jgi:hypothetical protein
MEAGDLPPCPLPGIRPGTNQVMYSMEGIFGGFPSGGGPEWFSLAQAAGIFVKYFPLAPRHRAGPRQGGTGLPLSDTSARGGCAPELPSKIRNRAGEPGRPPAYWPLKVTIWRAQVPDSLWLEVTL